MLICTSHSFSQNIVSNGDFEKSCFEVTSTFQKSSQILPFGCVKNWQSSGLSPSYIYKSEFDSIYPFSKKGGMAKMYYSESCPFKVPSGCFSYIQQKLKSKLEIGSKYVINFDFYMQGNDIVEKSILNNFGVYFSRLNEVVDNHELLKEDFFIPFKFEVGKWNKVSLQFRAICDLEFLTIGLFKNKSFPTIHRKIDNPANFFIDNIELIKIDSSDNSDNFIPYCQFFDHKKELVESTLDSLIIYFEKDGSELTSENSKNIIDFYTKYQKYGNPLIIEGHASNDGDKSANYILSERRTNSVKKLLKASFDIYNNSVLSINYGDNKSKETGNKGNDRKIILYFSRNTYAQHLYQKILEQVSNNDLDRAVKLLLFYIEAYKNENTIFLLFDCRLEKISQLPIWQKIVDRVKNTYKSPSTFYLDSMYCEDKKYRGLEFEVFSLGIDYLECKFHKKEISDSLVSSHDNNNLTSIKEFLNKHGLPLISDHGNRPCRALFYIIKHNNDLTLINKYLSELYEICKKGEADWFHYAIWKDVVDISTGQIQSYGTQIDRSKETAKEKFGDELDNINRRRELIGLFKI